MQVREAMRFRVYPRARAHPDTAPVKGRIQHSMLASFKGPFDRLRAGPQRGPGAKTRVSARNERLPWGKVKITEQPQRGCGLHGLQPPALVAAPDAVATASSADPG